MAMPLPSVADFRKILHSGQAAVRGQLRVRPGDESLQGALVEYRRTFGMLDAMTKDEESSPLTVIDSTRIRRIACGAGATDQQVIQLLFSYRDFCEQFMRAAWFGRNDGA